MYFQLYLIIKGVGQLVGQIVYGSYVCRVSCLDVNCIVEVKFYVVVIIVWVIVVVIGIMQVGWYVVLRVVLLNLVRVFMLIVFVKFFVLICRKVVIVINSCLYFVKKQFDLNFFLCRFVFCFLFGVICVCYLGE